MKRDAFAKWRLVCKITSRKATEKSDVKLADGNLGLAFVALGGFFGAPFYAFIKCIADCYKDKRR